MRRIVFIMLTVLFCPLLPVLAQSLDNTVKQRLTDFFKNYQTSHADIGTCKLDHFVLDHEKRTLQVCVAIVRLPAFHRGNNIGHLPSDHPVPSRSGQLLSNYYLRRRNAHRQPDSECIPQEEGYRPAVQKHQLPR